MTTICIGKSLHSLKLVAEKHLHERIAGKAEDLAMCDRLIADSTFLLVHTTVNHVSAFGVSP
jgi:hypothetical protein